MSLIQIIIVVLVGLGLYYFTLYNQLVTLEQKIKDGFANINIRIKRRYNLIPDLLEILKVYKEKEKSIFESITNLQSKALSIPSNNLVQIIETENIFNEILQTIFLLPEKYQDLRENKNFIAIKKELEEIEKQIVSLQKIYNNNVLDLNTKIDTSPSNKIANYHGIVKAEFYDLGEEENLEEVSEVSFK